MKKLFILLIAVAGLNFSSFAQLTADASSTATIIAPLTVTIVQGSELAFGNIIANAVEAGTVTVAASNAATRGFTLGAKEPLGTPGNVSSAQFDVTGELGETYGIIVSGSVTLYGSASAVNQTMIMIPSLSSESKTIGETEAENRLYVGGELQVKADQKNGPYLGTLTVTVAY